MAFPIIRPRLHLIVAVVVTVLGALTLTFCGSSKSGTGEVRSGSVVEITTSLKGDHGWSVLARDWYQPSTGRWSSQQPLDHTGYGFDGTEYWNSAPGMLHVVRGSRAYVAAVGPISFETAPGVYLNRMSALHPTGEYARLVPKIKVSHRGDETVLTSGFGYSTDSGSGVIPMRAVVAAPVSAAQAAKQGAFAPPAGRPTWLDVESVPGAPARFGTPTFWFGQAWNGETARATVETTSSPTPLLAGEQQGPSPAKTYDEIYQTASLPTFGSSRIPGKGPTFVGVPSSDPGGSGITVETSSISGGDNLITSQPPGATQPITLADGEHATLTSWYAYGGDLAMVTTKTARVVIRGLPRLNSEAPSDADACHLVELASALRPVGYRGGTIPILGSGADCLPRQPTLPEPSEFPQPGNPPANTKDFNLRGARRPTALTGCTSTGEQQTVANLEKALACTGPFGKWPARCARMSDPRAEPSFVTFAAATVMRQASCGAIRGQVLFDLQPTGWIPLFYAPHPICGGWTQVPVYILQRLFPDYFESNGPTSKRYLCPPQ